MSPSIRPPPLPVKQVLDRASDAVPNVRLERRHGPERQRPYNAALDLSQTALWTTVISKTFLIASALPVAICGDYSVNISARVRWL